jgi:hypothetical protein
MAKEIKIKAVLEDKLSGQVNTMSNNISKSTTKAAKSTNSVADQLVKRFLQVGFAIQAAKKSIDFMVDSFKAFEKASGGNTLTRLQQQFGQLQVEIGSALAPALTDMANWFERNSEIIQKVGRIIANVLVVSVQYLINRFNNLKLMFAGMTGLLVEAVVEPINLVVGAINKLVSIIPKRFIPDEWKEGLSNFSGGLNDFVGVNRRVVGQIAKDWKDNQIEMGKIIKDTFKDPGKSGVKYRTSDQIKVQEEYAKTILELKKRIGDEEIAIEDNNIREKFRRDLKAAADRTEIEEETNATRISVMASFYDLLLEERGRRLAMSEYAVDAHYNSMEEKFGKSSELEILREQEKYNKISKVLKEFNEETNGIFYENAEKIVDKYIEDATKKVEIIDETIDLSINSMKDGYEKEVALAGWAAEQEGRVWYSYRQEDLISEEQLKEALALIEDQRVAKVQEASDKTAQARKQEISDSISNFADYANKAMNIASQITDAQMDSIDREEEKRKDYINSTVKGEKTKAKEIAKIEKQAEAERKKVRKVELAMSLVTATANVAEGISKAIAQGGVAGIITGILVGAAGAVQLGVIGSQMAKLASGGIIGGQRRSGDQQIAQVNAGEMVINNDQQRRLYDIVSGRAQPSSGNGIVFNETISVNGNLDMNAAEKIRVDREKQITEMEETLREMQYRNRIQPVLF